MKTRYNTKDFRKYNFFILYDINDKLITYFDSYDELRKIINYPINKLVYQYNNSVNDYHKLIIQNRLYKLYTFTDDDLINV